MKIVEINIYGYGKFENVKFSNLHNQQIFFGENEAGKSTIMSFIHSILFGFPTKQQSELRYEPKKGAKYGGQLTVVFPGKGKTIIERVKGKATGDVAVRLEDGNVGGEELLKELLSSIDKNLYQAIFSFNLQGLQNVQQMKGEDLGRFLFSTGAIGSDRLLKVENELAKELESRFKPNGKNPLLNVKLKELHQLWQELRKAEENNEQYISLLGQKDTIEKQIGIIKSEAALLNHQQNRLEEWKKISPLFQKEKVIKKELSQFDDILFPENGLEQLEYLKQLQSQLERKVYTYQQRINHIQAEMNAILPDFSLIEKENEINTAVESLPLWEKWKQDNIQLQVKLKKLEENILFLQNKIHLPFSTHEILAANTSIFMKEQTAELQANQKRLAEKKCELDDQFQEEKRRLEELESSVTLIKGELLPEAERQHLKGKLSDVMSKEAVTKQQQEVKERLVLLTKSLQQAVDKKKKDKWQFLIFALLFAILCGWGFFSDALLLIVAGGIGLLFTIFSYLKINLTGADELLQIEFRNLQEKKADLDEKLRQPGEHIEILKQKLEKDSLQRERLFQLTVMLERQQEQYHHVIDRFELWEQEAAALQKEVLAVGRELKIPDEMAVKYLGDVFQIIEELKKYFQEQAFTIEQLNINNQAMQGVLGPIAELSLQFLHNDKMAPQEAVLILKRKLREGLEKKIKYKEKKDQLVKCQDDLKDDQLEWEQLRAEIKNLYSSASAQNEEHFRGIGQNAAQKKELSTQWNSLLIQIKLSSFNEEEVAKLSSENSPELSIQEIIDKRKMHEDELSHLQDELAALKYTIQLLEDGGTYAELLHRFKQLKGQFEDEAREWVRFAAAKEMLQKTVNNFKQERLPKMLSKAEEYLHFLTGGNYGRIIPKQEGSGFLIESKDHLLYEANELSQATAEQIYVSLRLALAVTVYEKYKLPIIIDDSFVNFDANRTSRVVELLQKLTGQQILFFTCHDHLLKYFQPTEIIHLEVGNSRVKRT